MRNTRILFALAALFLTACGGGGGGSLPATPANRGAEPGASASPGATATAVPGATANPGATASPGATATAAPSATPTPSSSVPAATGVVSACYLTGPNVRTDCVAVSNGGTIPYDDPLVLKFPSSGVTSAAVTPSANVYAYGGVGTNTIAIRWRRTPGVMYQVSSNGGTFYVTTSSPVAMPSVPAHSQTTGRYCVMGHSWTLNEQYTRVNNSNVPNAALNALIDSAEQAVGAAGATCARVEVQASFIWGGTTGSLSGAGADFSRYDYIATHLAQHGISMLPVILQYGGSRIQTTVGTNNAFASASDYGTYAGTVTRWIVQHNAQMASQGLPQIKTVELMNEPNQPYWFMDADTGAGIAQFMKAGYAAVKSVAPNLFAFGPGLANGGGSHINMYTVLGNLYGSGCRTGVCWDGLSVHNFAWQMDPRVYYGATYQNQWQNYRGAEAIAAANGETGVKFCLTETGFASDTSAFGEDPQVAARDMSLAYATALSDPQIACIVNASIWNGDDGGGPFADIGLGDISSGVWVPNPRLSAFSSFAL